ncbi:MAG: Cj0069 family protein [Dehalococcoidia bacterium]
MARDDAVRVAVLWRGDARAPVPLLAERRHVRIFEELTKLGASAEPIVFADDAVDAVREQLLSMDGVLVWVDPIMGGVDRTVLDGLLREVAAADVFVSAHPDVILKMGTKQVLVDTRDMAWGGDTYLYRAEEELRAGLPARLREGRPRVLKQHRGNGGDGVWKVELARDASTDGDASVRVLHALRGATVEEMSLETWFERCGPYLEGTGCLVDQPYAERLDEGMTRVYLSQDRVVGFGHQFVTALTPPPPGEAGPPAPPPRIYFGPSKLEFQPLKALLEGGWVAEMQRVLGIEREALPAIWDADFLLGPRAADGTDTYLLCEINVSSVFPIPDEACAPLAATAVELARAAREHRTA